MADEIRYGPAVVALGHHPAHIVVYSSAEDRTGNDPYEDDRPPFRSHQGTEYGAGTCYVEKLDEVVLHPGHRDVIDAVRMRYCGCRITEGDYHPLDESAVYQIAQQKAHQTYN